ncbi:MAG: AAA family ATPase [Proteobacteria bacterium]|nr:AAA family ATPase [Pseudomonadota bacterium]
MREPSSRIITFANIKGGVGKTTSVTNIAYLLGVELGKRVLVIDSDDQGNATKALGVRDRFDRNQETLWHALRNKLSFDQVMVESPYKNIWVIPSTKELKAAQTEFGRSARSFKLFKHLLKGVSKNFDYVLIDTKPQINVLLQAALAASQWYLIPSFPEPDSYDGFLDLVAECEEIRDEENPELNCLGVMLSCVKKISAHDTYIRFISKHLKLAKVSLLKPSIRVSNAVATGNLHSCPAASLPSARTVRDDYLKLTRALVKLVEHSRKIDRPDLKRLGVLREVVRESSAWQISDELEEIKML